MRLTPEQRSLIGSAVDRIGNKTLVAKVFGVSRNTIYKWSRRRKYLRDRKRKPKKSKITRDIEQYILGLRTLFKWGSDRIKKGLWHLPKFMRDTLKSLDIKICQNVKLSRQAINNVIKKRKLNGYIKKNKGWKFFRAKVPNELWQLDIKGPFRMRGKTYYFIICIDDYSRYLLLAEQILHAPSIEDICSLLTKIVLKYNPKSILTDNNPFKEEWDNWCKDNGIEPMQAHPYYPQDKGKVERNIRNVAEEFIYLLKKFPAWLNGKIKDYKKWFNNNRFHNGINAIPCQLFT